MVEALRSYLSRSRKPFWVVFIVSVGVTAWRLVDVIDNFQVLASARENQYVQAIWSFASDPDLHGALLIAGAILVVFFLVRKFRAKAIASSNVPGFREAKEIERKRESVAEDEEEIEVLIKYRRRRRVPPGRRHS